MTSSIAMFGYALNTLAFLFLMTMLLTSWRGRLTGFSLVAVVAAQFVWGFIAGTWHFTEQPVWLWLYGISESLRYLLWFVFLYSLLKPMAQNSIKPVENLFRIQLPIYATIGLILLSQVFLPVSIWLRANLGANVHYVAFLVMSILALVMVEKLFRHTRQEQRWAIRFLCLTMATVFVYDFYFYANAVLFNQISFEIEAARGYINMMAMPLLAIAVARNPKWTVDLFISRNVVIRSFTVLAAGVYLLVMAAVGYYIKTTDADWGETLQLVFFVGSILGLIILISSGQVRSRVRLFFSKHFFQYQYDYREEWLKFNSTLTAAQTGNRFHEFAVRALAEMVDSTGGMLWLRNESERCRYVDHWAMAAINEDLLILDNSMVTFMEETSWIIDFSEYMKQSDKYAGLEVPKEVLEIPNAWLMIPLLRAEQLEGVILLAEPRAVRETNWEDLDLLKAAGQQLAGHIALYNTTAKLVDARQFEAFNRLSAFVVHDLKNIVAQLSLISTNAEKHKDNPEFIDDVFKTTQNATRKMQRMLSQLRKGSEASSGVTEVSLLPIIEQVVSARSVDQPAPTFVCTNPELKVRADADKLNSVLLHLVQNAQEATNASGTVRIEASESGNDVIICVIDDGCGMSESFIRDRLFRPFDTTKGNAGMGIGVYQGKELIRSFGGEMTVTSKVSEAGAASGAAPGSGQSDSGTTFRIVLARVMGE